MPDLILDPHPSLRVLAFGTTLPAALGTLPSPPWLVEFLALTAPAPVSSSDALRTAMRDMLRHGGYKPTGRGKPASEYLLRTAQDTGLRSINLAVDANNAVSLHSGFPVSVIDLDRATAPFAIGLGKPGEKYVFHASGQEIDVEGLVCLRDGSGPCANAVKDAQRSKTQDDTRRMLSIVWGCAGFEAELERATAWYRQLTARAGAVTESSGVVTGEQGK